MKLNNKGFSLVEVLLAVAISTIVFGAITAMMIFATNSMRDTSDKVALQNQVKDAMNHIESYCMEAEDASWQKVSAGGQMVDALIVFEKRKDVKPIRTTSEGAVKAEEVENLESYAYVYWLMDDDSDASNGKCLYFGKCSKDGDIKLATLTAADRYLLADGIEKFECKIDKNKKSGKYQIDLKLEAKVNRSEYSTNKTVYLRNQ